MEAGCKCVAYADGLLLIVEGQSPLEIERQGTDWMGIVLEWRVIVVLGMSEGKTVTMLLKDSMAAIRRPCVRMNGKLIRYSECVKYLGVSVSESMNCKTHFERMKIKITNVVGQMRCALKCE